MNQKQVINALLNTESEITSKFHSVITEILRLGHPTPRSVEEIEHLIDSVEYSLEELKRVLNR